MDPQGNIDTATTFADQDDVTLGELLAVFRSVAERPLIFTYDGRDVQPGYHVTEVKAGRFAAVDCGGNPEAWSETFVQLWDVNEDRSHMPAGRFAAIIGKGVDHVGPDMDAKLTFEVSDGLRPMQLHRASAPVVAADAVRVALSPRPASCKPRDRWLEEHRVSCCAPSSFPCCG